MSSDVAVAASAELLERVVIGGNLAQLSARERMDYYRVVCESVGLNPLTRPFDYITLSGKLTLYAKKDATDQLRTIHDVSIVPPLESKVVEGIYVVTAYAKNGKGRTDTATGAVSIEGLKGESRANAMMKAETKAKRRVTLSICGLGLLDESEVDSLPGAILGEPAAPATAAYDQNIADRHALLEEIKNDTRTLGLTRADYKRNWTEYIGRDVSEEAAPIANVMKLANHLAGLVGAAKKGEPAPAEVVEVGANEIPF